jgi:hypothetical protein
MRLYRIKPAYLILFSILMIGLFACILFPNTVTQSKTFSVISIIISIAAVIFAVVALAITDKQEIKATISAKLSRAKGHDKYKIVIQNKSHEDLRNSFISLRIPEKILIECLSSNYSTHIFGETKILTFDFMKYFPNLNNENEFVVELTLKLDDWSKGNILLTISADNVKQTTLRLNHSKGFTEPRDFEVV